MRSRIVLIAIAAALLGAPARAQEIAPPAGGCHYDVTLLDPEAHRLAVTMACAGDGPFQIATYRYLTDAHIRDLRGANGSTVAKGENSWELKGQGGVARATYAFDVDEMAGATNSPSIGQRSDGSVVASVRSFLLVPDGGAKPLALTLRFRAPAGAGVLTGLARSGEERHQVERLDTADFPYIGFMAMGRIEALAIPTKLRDGEGVITVAILDGKRAVTNAELAHWIAASARLIGDYFGGFPARRALIILAPVDGVRYLRRGMVAGGGGVTMLLLIGGETKASDLFGQWMLTHELVHFAAPFIDGHAWLMEGMAVYVETRLRVGVGWFPADDAWRGFLRNVRNGVPAMQQQGLAQARGIGPTYWGGALFMMLADVEIIARTNGAKSLADCFRAVLAEGGDAAARWPVERFLKACDAATGGDTVSRLASLHVWKGTKLDLAGFWTKLGVQLTEYEAGVKYDDAAPWAWVRKRIMSAPPTTR